jgi:hypothetical protein
MLPARDRRGEPRDTAPEVEQAQLEVYRAMSPARKLEIVEDANHTARLLALTGLAARFPRADEQELHLRLFHLLHGSELATQVWGPLPKELTSDP